MSFQQDLQFPKFIAFIAFKTNLSTHEFCYFDGNHNLFVSFTQQFFFYSLKSCFNDYEITNLRA